MPCDVLLEALAPAFFQEKELRDRRRQEEAALSRAHEGAGHSEAQENDRKAVIKSNRHLPPCDSFLCLEGRSSLSPSVLLPRKLLFILQDVDQMSPHP